MVQKQPETPSEIIKAARDKSDLTVEELTDRVGITERYLYRIENEGKIPTFEVLKKIVRELAIDGNLIFYPEKQVKDSEVEDLVRMCSVFVHTQSRSQCAAADDWNTCKFQKPLHSSVLSVLAMQNRKCKVDFLNSISSVK